MRLQAEFLSRYRQASQHELRCLKMSAYTGSSREERAGNNAGTEWTPPSSIDCVRTIRQTSLILGVGEPSLRAMILKGTGPEIVRLSARRIGIKDSARERWLSARNAQPA
jgi:predicted DNA-binding transcriptional regulator AlpA